MLSRSGKGRVVVVILVNLVADRYRDDLLVEEERSKKSVVIPGPMSAATR